MKRITRLTCITLGILVGVVSASAAELATPSVSQTPAATALTDTAKIHSGQPDTNLASLRRGPTDNQLGLHSGGGGWGFFPAKKVDPNLPRVLLVGDSVMNGYRADVSRLLAGKANVDALTTGMHLADEHLSADLGKVLQQGPYAVIHFNIGLHDWPEGRIPPGQYEPLMQRYVGTYVSNAPAAKLIWASSTPVTVKGGKDLDPKINPVILRQNEIAARVMAAHGITINDLYTLGTGKLSLARGDQFHWTPEGARLMAERVSRHISDVLPPKPFSTEVKSPATDSTRP